LWQSERGRIVAAEIKRWDDYFLPQSTAIYANSRTVAERLLRFNGVAAMPLYHPPFNHTKLRTGRWDNYILYPGRFDAMKRQHLIVQAMEKTPERVQLVLCGNSDSAYGVQLRGEIANSPLRSRIKILGYVSESEKLDLYANCLAVYNGVVDEDYGYVTLEAFCAGKPVITHTDSGGPLEFVVDARNGYVTEPEADELARCITSLVDNAAHVRELGANARQTMDDKNISWDHVIEKLLDG
jgi:glycosyltransferase involved in cell wall biosynthesis